MSNHVPNMPWMSRFNSYLLLKNLKDKNTQTYAAKVKFDQSPFERWLVDT